jgi:hypothetical protein
LELDGDLVGRLSNLRFENLVDKHDAIVFSEVG